MDIKKILIYHKSKGVLPGRYPMFVKVLRADIKLKKKYFISCLEDELLFCNIGFAGSRKISSDLKISYSLIKHFTYAAFKQYMKKVTVHLTDGRTIQLGFYCNRSDYKDNEINALQLMRHLKSQKVSEQNLKKGKIDAKNRKHKRIKGN